MESYVEKAREVVNQVNRVILGKEREVAAVQSGYYVEEFADILKQLFRTE